ncbi:MAG: ABC-F family ATP-binding cassette domain-containing protein, partial [Lentisphaeria bacterium]|nr:ABC-F family ATP-binding cassette domain-containing protein [Lentisphaeria bacterium]
RSLIDFTADAIPELRTMAQELHRIEALLQENNNDQNRLLIRHGELQSAMEQMGAYRLRNDAEAALCNLGFAVDALERPLNSFSGGWQMRAALARVLIAQPDLLMLDEPSNYLDIPAVEYLYRSLTGFKGTLLLISHDRYLLRKLTHITLEVNGGQITRYPGDYDFYRQERENRRRTLEAAKRNNDRKKEHLERGIDRFRAKSSKAAAAKSWKKALDRIEDIELPDELGFSGVIRLPEPPPCGTPCAELTNLSFAYPGSENLLHDVTLRIENGDKIAFIGYNGTGKTTLLKLLMGRLKPDTGDVWYGHHVNIGYQAQEFSELLVPEQSVYDTVRGALPPGASTANLMNVLGSFGFSGDDTDKLCRVLSGGEKIRLSFARIFVNPPNLLILDEPTTHLDVRARELLQEALKNYKGTVCFVSHDLEFVRGVATTIIAMENHSIKRYYGNYDYYLEKSQAIAAAAKEPEKPAKAAAKPAETAESDLSGKDRRRERAKQRAGISGIRRKLENAVADAEKKLADLEARQQELVAQMSGDDKVDFEQLNREMTEVQNAMEETMKAWEDAAWELERFLKDNAQ